MADYKNSKTERFNDMFVIIDNFSKYKWWVSLKNKNGQTLTDEILKFLTTSKRKAIEIENDRGLQLIKVEFQKILKLKN